MNRILIFAFVMLASISAVSANAADQGFNWFYNGTQIDLSGDIGIQGGIHCEEAYCYVADRQDGRVYNYSLPSWTLQPTSYFVAQGPHVQFDLSCNTNNCYVLENDNEVHVFDRSWSYQSTSFSVVDQPITKQALDCTDSRCYVTGFRTAAPVSSTVSVYLLNGTYLANESFSVLNQTDEPTAIGCEGDYCYVSGFNQDTGLFQYMNRSYTGRFTSTIGTIQDGLFRMSFTGLESDSKLYAFDTFVSKPKMYEFIFVGSANVTLSCSEKYTGSSITCDEPGPYNETFNVPQTKTVNATGYFSQQVTYTPQSTGDITISIPGFYNFNLTINVSNYNNTPAEFFSITINNTVLGLNQTNSSVINPAITYSLLRGYDYDVKVASTTEPFQYGIVTLTNQTSIGTETRTYDLELSTVPVVETVTITNASSVILGFANITDVDGDNQTAEYEWYKNSVLYSSGSTTIPSPGRYNFANLTAPDYSSGDTIIFSVRSNDGVSTTDWKNSTAFLTSDTSPPIVENATQPSTVTQNNIGTFTVQATDNGAIDRVIVSWLDPNSITSGELQMSLSAGNTYMRSFTFTTTGTYSNISFKAIDGNGLQTVLTGLNFTVTAASGGGGGGGGSTTIEVPNAVRATLEAQPPEVYIGPFNSGGELVITNEESGATEYTIRILQTDLGDRITFAGSKSATFIVEGQGSLGGNKKFVSYTIDQEDIEVGEYSATFELVDAAGRIVDTATVRVIVGTNPLTGLISGLQTPVIGTTTAGTILFVVLFAMIAGILIFRAPKTSVGRSRS